ncbi:zinc-finger domain-containing protein [Wolbachia endosymbiont of Tettigetta isshikii]|uniref:zinc-finger domain-containing protein n=1 Tax=Wolbachia endosymbiont of Tettigetta isshikii TaxID=3239093 RepID=UPI003980C47E
MTVGDNDIIVCCRGDENDDGSGHPLIYLYKEGSETFCPYCNKLMNEEFKFEESEKFKSNEESKSVAGCIVTAANRKRRTHG